MDLKIKLPCMPMPIRTLVPMELGLDLSDLIFKKKKSPSNAGPDMKTFPKLMQNNLKDGP
jgi:hypothetical protein